MLDHIEELRTITDVATDVLMEISEETAGCSPAPGKWSPKEILGHMIDSATHNHHRILEASTKEQVFFGGYDQDTWVATHQYKSYSWHALIQFWKYYNLHICQLVRNLSPEILSRNNISYGYSLMSGKREDQTGNISIECIFKDYVIHLKHHLRQITFPSRVRQY